MIDYIKLENKYEFNVFPKREITIVEGDNDVVWDSDGKEYIDCVSGHGVANLGHKNREVIDAIREQAERLITCPGIFYNDTRALLLEKLIKITPKNLQRVFLCNSGAESIEAAIKFSRLSTGKSDIICAMRSYHGRTMGALSATFNPKYKTDFEPLVPGFKFAPFNNFEKLEEKVNDITAAVLLEIVQGEGGVNIGKKKYFQKVEKLCQEKNLIFIIDEVQTGFGRTGKLFASEHFNLQPDLLCLAKSIGGGVPMGAVICSDKIQDASGKHGTTFGGNPLVCAASSAAIDYIVDNNLALQSKEKGDYLSSELQKHNLSRVREIRQIGLMVGIELKEKSKPLILTLMNEGILTLPAGPIVLRLLPPLTITYQNLDKVIQALIKILK
jgi:acetylornithine/LysW-gamma-L-lysine aminotransferase